MKKTQKNKPAASRQKPKHKQVYRKAKPALRFSPTAWAKLLYFRDRKDNEIGGFGISRPDDLLFVTDFVTVKQDVTIVSVDFDDEAVSDFFETQVDAGRRPEQFARIWCHTHPSDSPTPSQTDESTFERVFGQCQWAVMFILAEDNRTYARLGFNVGPGGSILIPVEVEYGLEFGSSDWQAWKEEYDANIHPVTWTTTLSTDKQKDSEIIDYDDYCLPTDVIEQIEEMEPAERQFVLNELAERPDLWNDESEVFI